MGEFRYRFLWDPDDSHGETSSDAEAEIRQLKAMAAMCDWPNDPFHPASARSRRAQRRSVRCAYTSGVVLLAVVLAAPSRASAQSFDGVLARLRTYLVSYEPQLSSLVALETYRQQYQDPLRGPTAPASTRMLRSDFAFVRLPGDREWLGLRDVFEVDGRPIRDRDVADWARRVTGSDNPRAEAQRLVAVNVRYNFGPLQRTINVPAVALDLLSSRYSSRFAFRQAGVETIDGRPLWRVEARERGRPTIIRSLDGENQRSRVLAWVDPIDGSVLRTTLAINEHQKGVIRSTITVDYVMDSRLGFRVPATMNEYYAGPGIDPRQGATTADATYTEYRRFQASGRLVE